MMSSKALTTVFVAWFKEVGWVIFRFSLKEVPLVRRQVDL
jgi:hypothetical protein